jgi:predicted RNA binding protein YcfA (HicA-like mRNA interferase family)
MKLPRDIGGKDLADLLSQYGYKITRQTGSHLRLASSVRDSVHCVTLPNHMGATGFGLAMTHHLVPLGPISRRLPCDRRRLRQGSESLLTRVNLPVTVFTAASGRSRSTLGLDVVV